MTESRWVSMDGTFRSQENHWSWRVHGFAQGAERSRWLREVTQRFISFSWPRCTVHRV